MDEHELDMILRAAQGWSELFAAAVANGTSAKTSVDKSANASADTSPDTATGGLPNTCKSDGNASADTSSGTAAGSSVDATMPLVQSNLSPTQDESSCARDGWLSARKESHRSFQTAEYPAYMREFVRDYLGQIHGPNREWLTAVAEQTIDLMGKYPVDSHLEFSDADDDAEILATTTGGIAHTVPRSTPERIRDNASEAV